jgi:hypothetical protein
MGKKSGKAGTVKSPAAPDKAKEPDVADPGEMSKIEAEQAKTKQLKPGSTKIESSSASEEEESHWVGIKLKDDQGNPVAGEPFKLKLPDGTIVEGTLDDEGKAEIHGVPEGQSQVCFPKIDKDEWKPA